MFSYLLSNPIHIHCIVNIHTDPRCGRSVSFLSLSRDPSTLESLSSVLTGVSSYVASNLPASFSVPSKGGPNTPSNPGFSTNSTNAYYYPALQASTNPLLGGHQENLCVLTNGDVVLFSAFDWIDSGSPSKNRFSR